MVQYGQKFRLAKNNEPVFPFWKGGEFTALEEVGTGFFGCPVWLLAAPDGELVKLGLDWFEGHYACPN